MNDLIIQTTSIVELYKKDNYVVFQNPNDFLSRCKLIVQAALDCKGDNKTDQTIEATMIIQLSKILLLNFSHVSMDLIEQTLLINHYGEGYVANVSAMITVLEKAGLNNSSIENKKRIAKEEEEEYYRKKEEQNKKDYELNGEKREKQRCVDRYEDWKKTGEFSDLSNETFSRLLNGKISFSKESIQTAKEIALSRAKEQLRAKKDKEARVLNFEATKKINCILENQNLLEKDNHYIYFFKHELVKEYFKTRFEKENNKK